MPLVIKMKVQLLYSDRDIAVCLKPAGLSSQEGGMPGLLREALGREIYCVHRLDTAVGGLMVYARSRGAAAALSADIAGRRFEKGYLAIVQGLPQPEDGILRDLLFHDRAKNKSYVVKRSRKGVKAAELEYRLLEERAGLGLVSVRLMTGRSHQIRVQFASRGLPLAGDTRYGGSRREEGICLWSRALAFSHPVSGKSMSFSAPPPRHGLWADFGSIWTKENDNG